VRLKDGSLDSVTAINGNFIAFRNSHSHDAKSITKVAHGFEVGDWVRLELTGSVGEITQVDDTHAEVTGCGCIPVDEITKVAHGLVVGDWVRDAAIGLGEVHYLTSRKKHD